MSTNTLFINDKDAFTTWGAILGDNSVNALITPAPAKPFVSNTSRLIDGIRIVNGPVRIDKRDLTLTIHISATGYEQFTDRLNGLIKELCKGIARIRTKYQPGVTYRLIYRSCTQLNQIRGQLGKVIIKFTEPNPADRL